jgi:hypothetical protein
MLINCLKSHLKPKKEVFPDLYPQIKLRVRLQQLSQIYLSNFIDEVKDVSKQNNFNTEIIIISLYTLLKSDIMAPRL